MIHLGDIMSTLGGGGCSVYRRDIMSTMGDITIHVGEQIDKSL